MTRARWSVYLVRRADGALYCGIAIDVAARVAAHAAGRGAKALRGRGPLQLVLQRRVGDRAQAQRVEARIKRLTKTAKERLVRSPRSAFARQQLAVAAARAAASNGSIAARARRVHVGGGP